MDQYLKEAKESNTMDHSQIAGDIRDKREKEEHKIGSGLEAEIERMKERAKYCREQSEVLEGEADNLDKAILHLENASGLLGGKPAKRAHGGKWGFSVWPERYKEILPKPMRKKELIDEIEKRYGIKNAYAPIGKALASGTLKEVDGMIEFVADGGE